MQDSPIGTLIPISGFDARTGKEYEHFAFAPVPLPDPTSLSLDGSTWTGISRAESALARLDEAGHQVPDAALLRRPAIRREAQSTSALEGTYAPIETVLESELGDRSSMSSTVYEILNYVVAAEYAFDWIADRAVSLSMVSQAQDLLVRGTPGEKLDTGRVRECQVVIGSPDGSVLDSRFVPPPPGDQLRAGVEALLTWIQHTRSEVPSTLRAALAHYQFETLHPFSDGNGRLGRLLIAVQFVTDEILAEPLLVVSPWFESRRRQYQDMLLSTSETGDFEPWIRFFAEGVAESADQTRRRIDLLLDLRQEMIRRVREAGVSGSAERIAGDLIGTPYIRVKDVVESHGISRQAAMKSLGRLEELSLLTKQRRGRQNVWVAGDVVTLIRA